MLVDKVDISKNSFILVFVRVCVCEHMIHAFPAWVSALNGPPCPKESGHVPDNSLSLNKQTQKDINKKVMDSISSSQYYRLNKFL